MPPIPVNRCSHCQMLGCSKSRIKSPQFQNPFVVDPKVNYSFLKGRHSLKFGYEFMSINTEIDDFNPVYGSENFGAGFSSFYYLKRFETRCHFPGVEVVPTGGLQHAEGGGLGTWRLRSVRQPWLR